MLDHAQVTNIEVNTHQYLSMIRLYMNSCVTLTLTSWLWTVMEPLQRSSPVLTSRTFCWHSSEYEAGHASHQSADNHCTEWATNTCHWLMIDWLLLFKLLTKNMQFRGLKKKVGEYKKLTGELPGKNRLCPKFSENWPQIIIRYLAPGWGIQR